MLIYLMLLALGVYFLVPILLPLFESQKKLNYRGDPLPSSLGLSFVLPAVTLQVLAKSKGQPELIFPLILLFFTLLGLVDDFLDSGAKGFRGHFAQTEISTGVLKAVAGLAFSLALSFSLTSARWGAVLDGALIALGANSLNLLDLRPGRAAKAFFLLNLPLLLFRTAVLPPLYWLNAALAGYLPWDLRERVMMGDAGSNALGAAWGLAAAVSLPGPAKVLAAAALLTLNIFSERISLSRVIENNRVLSFLDRLGR